MELETLLYMNVSVCAFEEFISSTIVCHFADKDEKLGLAVMEEGSRKAAKIGGNDSEQQAESPREDDRIYNRNIPLEI